MTEPTPEQFVFERIYFILYITIFNAHGSAIIYELDISAVAEAATITNEDTEKKKLHKSKGHKTSYSLGAGEII